MVLPRTSVFALWAWVPKAIPAPVRRRLSRDHWGFAGPVRRSKPNCCIRSSEEEALPSTDRSKNYKEHSRGKFISIFINVALNMRPPVYDLSIYRAPRPLALH